MFQVNPKNWTIKNKLTMNYPGGSPGMGCAAGFLRIFRPPPFQVPMVPRPDNLSL